MEAWHPNPDFFYRPGGGPILDMGPYYVTNLVQLIGPVKAVTAMASTCLKTRTIGNGPRKGEEIPVETPTSTCAILEFHNGALVTLSASWDVWAHRHPPMELYGTQASLFIPDPNLFGGEVQLAGGDGSTVSVPSKDHPFAIPNTHDMRGIGRANYRGAGLADMAQAVVQDRPHRCSFELAAHVVEVMTAIADRLCAPRDPNTGSSSRTSAQPGGLNRTLLRQSERRMEYDRGPRANAPGSVLSFVRAGPKRALARGR